MSMVAAWQRKKKKKKKKHGSMAYGEKKKAKAS